MKAGKRERRLNFNPPLMTRGKSGSLNLGVISKSYKIYLVLYKRWSKWIFTKTERKRITYLRGDGVKVS